MQNLRLRIPLRRDTCVRLQCYLKLLETALPANRAVLSLYPAAMCYFGRHIFRFRLSD
jgi:hypothetical protein